MTTRTTTTYGRSDRTRLPGPTLGLLGLAAALLAGGCARGEANEAAGTLQTAAVERRTIISSVEATGTIEPIKIIDVKSQASGEILELPVELGDYVERGALLVRIDPRDVRNALEQAEADLEVAEARFEVAERQLSRVRALRDSAVVTEEELESAMLEHATARANLVKARTNLELAQDRMNDVTLRAPLSGTIVERQIEEGQIITGAREVTGGTVLMRMADLAQVQVRTLVDETDIGRVEAGLPAEIRVEAYPDRTFTGTVLKIEPQAVVEQNVTMFAVLTRIANEDDLLRPGMNADVTMVLGREENVLALPNAGVKMPAEARQLAQALEVDTSPLGAGRDGGSARPAASVTGDGARSASAGAQGERTSGQARGGADGRAGGREGGELSMERVRSMSAEERRRAFENLSASQRQELFARMRQQQEAEALADRINPSRARPAFVFVATPAGEIQLKPVTVGLSNWDYTQILEGLEEGDRVLQIPLSIIQQQELLDRVRSRSAVPGVSRN